MHGPAVGFGENGLGVTPMVTLGYLLVATFLYLCPRFAESEALEKQSTGTTGDLASAPSGAD